jgi:hypothetical protein
LENAELYFQDSTKEQKPVTFVTGSQEGARGMGVEAG